MLLQTVGLFRLYSIRRRADQISPPEAEGMGGNHWANPSAVQGSAQQNALVERSKRALARRLLQNLACLNMAGPVGFSANLYPPLHAPCLFQVVGTTARLTAFSMWYGEPGACVKFCPSKLKYRGYR